MASRLFTSIVFGAVLVCAACNKPQPAPPSPPVTPAAQVPPAPADEPAVRYCRLVFGPKGETGVWLILDRDGRLHVDTEGKGAVPTRGIEAEKLTAKGIEKAKFRLKTLREPGSAVTHSDLIVTEKALTREEIVGTMGGGTILDYEFETKPTAGYTPADLVAALKKRLDPAEISGLTVRFQSSSPRVELVVTGASGRDNDYIDNLKRLVETTEGLPFGAVLKGRPVSETSVGASTKDDAPERKKSYDEIEKALSMFVIGLNTKGTFLQTATLSGFSASPDDAPVLHFNGPLTMLGTVPPNVMVYFNADGSETLRLQLSAEIGTRAKGKLREFDVVVDPASIPQHLLPTANVLIFPGQPGKDPIRLQQKLDRVPSFDSCDVYGTFVTIPPGQPRGKGTVIFSFSTWDGGQVTPSTRDFSFDSKQKPK